MLYLFLTILAYVLLPKEYNDLDTDIHFERT